MAQSTGQGAIKRRFAARPGCLALRCGERVWAGVEPVAGGARNRRRALLVLGALAATLAAVPPAAAAGHGVQARPVTARPTLTHLRGVYRLITADVARGATDLRVGRPPELGHTHDVTREVLEVDGRWVDVRLPRGHHLRPGQHVELTGTGDSTGFDAQAITAIPGPAAAVDTTDVTRTLVILAYWGSSHDSVTKAKASEVIFTQGNPWWKEVSYGLTSLSGTVVDWVHISAPDGGDCYGRGDQVMSRARSAAAARIGSLSGYERTIVYFPFCPAAAYAAGWAYVPGTSVWLNGYMDKRVSIHEQGHNYGLLHAHSLTCSTGALTGSCNASEYGDSYDAMGGDSYVGHFNAAEKNRLAWMSGRVHGFTSSGSYTIAPLETSSGVKAGKVVAGGRSYWIEYRTAAGQDRSFPAGGLGVLVHALGGSPGLSDGGSHLLDLQRGVESGFDAPAVSLVKGASWTSPEQVRISFVGANTSGAQVSVTFGAPPAGLPNAPGSVTAKAGDTTALVGWGVPADNGDSLIGYRVYYQRSGGAVAHVDVNSAAGAVHATNLTGLTNATTYSVWVRARNGVGEGPASATVSVTPQIQVPTASVTSPVAAQQVNADAATLTATATANPISKKAITEVDFYVDGQFYSSDSTAPYSVPWDAAYERDGAHTVQAWAVDANNRVGRSAVVSFTLTKPVPTVAITSAVPSGADANILDVHLSATSGSPQAAVDFVTLTYDNGEFAGSVNSPTNLGDIVVPWDTHYVPNGAHQLVATVSSSLSRVGTSPPFAVDIAHPTPVVAITAPTASSTQYGNFTVAVSALPGHTSTGASGAAIQQVEVVVDATTSVGSDFDGSDGWSVDIQGSQLTPGPHTVTARAVDADGFTGSSGAVPVTFERPQPRVTISSPTGTEPVYGQSAGAVVNVVTHPQPSLNGASPVSWVEVLADGTTSLGAAYGPDTPDDPTSPWTVAVPLTLLSSGSHTLVARVTDQNQYVGESAPLAIDVIVPSPSVTLSTVSCPASPCDVAFTVSASATPSSVSGAAIEHVEFLVDGTAPQPDYDGSDGYTATIDPNAFDSRSHVITARAVDVNGYQQTSAGQSITFLTPGPSAAITAPAAGARPLVDTNPLTITGTVQPASDASPLNSIVAEVDGNPQDYKTPADLTGNVIEFSLPFISSGPHSLVIAVSDDAGRTRRSSPVAITVLMRPAAPYAFAYGGDGKITVQWQATTDTGGAPLESYKIRRSLVSDPGTVVQTVTLTAAQINPASTDLSYDFTGMPPGVDEQFTVAVKTVGVPESDQSYPTTAQAYDSTPPAPVSGLTAVGGIGSVRLSWVRSTSTDVSTQSVYLDQGATPTLYSAPTELNGAASSATVSGLATGQDYVASVVSTDGAFNVSPPVSSVIRATKLSLTRSLSTVTYGGSLTLKATLSKVAGGALGNRVVVFKGRRKGTATWTTLKSVTTSSTATALGVATLVVKPTVNYEYAASFAGGPGLFGVATGAAPVLVKPKLTSSLSATSLRLGGYVYVRASIAPAHASQYVLVQRLVSGTWRTLAAVRLSTSSTLNYKWKPPTKGSYALRVYKAADTDHAAVAGTTLTLKVA